MVGDLVQGINNHADYKVSIVAWAENAEEGRKQNAVLIKLPAQQID